MVLSPPFNKRWLASTCYSEASLLHERHPTLALLSSCCHWHSSFYSILQHHRQQLTTDWLSIELYSEFPSSSEPMASFLDFAAEAHRLNFDKLQPPSSCLSQRQQQQQQQRPLKEGEVKVAAISSRVTTLVAPDLGNDLEIASAVAPTAAMAPLSGWCSWYDEL